MAHRSHRRDDGGDVTEEEAMAQFQEMYEKEEEAIDAEEERKQREAEGSGSESGSDSDTEAGTRKGRSSRAHENNHDDDLEDENATPKMGRWEQVWLGPSKGWYKVWVPDCFGKPVGVPVPVPGNLSLPPINGPSYPSTLASNEDDPNEGVWDDDSSSDDDEVDHVIPAQQPILLQQQPQLVQPLASSPHLGHSSPAVRRAGLSSPALPRVSE